MNSTLKKQPNEIQDDDLLKILEEPSDIEVPVEKPIEHPVVQFLADFGIYPGNQEVLNYIIYSLFIKNMRNSGVTKKQFYTLLDGYLPSKVNSRKTFYLVNKSSKTLTDRLALFLTEKKKKVKNKPYRQHMEAFINDLSIQEGKYAIPTSSLYYFYKEWTVTHRKYKLNYKNFRALLYVYFPQVQTKRNKNMIQIDEKQFSKKQDEIKTSLEWAKRSYGSKEKKDTPGEE